jgi:hypothetical protein
MALFGIVYLLMPGCRRRVLASVHFWGHNIGFPVMKLSLGMFLSGAKCSPTNPYARPVGRGCTRRGEVFSGGTG